MALVQPSDVLIGRGGWPLAVVLAGLLLGIVVGSVVQTRRDRRAFDRHVDEALAVVSDGRRP
jgi:hypothetical protein